MNHVIPPPTWTAEDARADFDELARRAQQEGPQRVVLSNGASVLVTPERPPARPANEDTAEILAFLQSLHLEGIDLERDDAEGEEPDLRL